MLAVKFADGSEDIIEGPGMPFGGPWANGQDLAGEHFSKATDFAFDWFPEDGRPLLYHHGLDKDAGVSPVGRVKGYEIRADVGVWTQAQLDKSSEYFGAINGLVKAGKLFFSSGAMAHLVNIDQRSGEIKRWPWVELSLTPTPANLLAAVDFATASKHFKSAGLELPGTVTAPEADLPAPAALKAVSWQDVGNEVRKALEERMEMASPFDVGGCVCIEETYSDHVIACLWEKGEERYFSVPFTLAEDGHVATVGQAEEMEETYVPKKPAQPVGTMAWVATRYAASLLESTKGLQQRRLKEGRVISDTNRKRLAACMEQMGAAMKEMQSLLDSTAPQPAKAAAVWRLQAQLVAQQLEAMSLN